MLLDCNVSGDVAVEDRLLKLDRFAMDSLNHRVVHLSSTVEGRDVFEVFPKEGCTLLHGSAGLASVSGFLIDAVESICSFTNLPNTNIAEE